MYPKSLLGKIILALAAIALAGCSMATAEPTPTQAPTIDPQPTFDAIATQSVQTMAANLTMNAPTATPIVPTDTPEPPTPTVPPLPTNTPEPTNTPTRAFIPWTATPTATQATFACQVVEVSPKASDKITVDQDFDAKWSLKNTGTKTWNAGNTDIVYSSGQKMHTGGDIIDLGSDVAPNGTYTVIIDMKAPSGDGKYTTTWGMTLEDGSVCTLSLTINVVK